MSEAFTPYERKALAKMGESYRSKAAYHESLAEADGPGTHRAGIERNGLLARAIELALAEPAPKEPAAPASPYERDAKHVALQMEVCGIETIADAELLRKLVEAGAFD